jgi:TPR repeat protein
MYSLAAAQDYGPAVSALGKCHYYGTGVERSVGEAVDLWRHAAELDDPRGCYYYGMVAEDSLGLFKRSADAGDPFGQCAFGIELARLKQFGDAARWFGRAAEQDDVGGHFNLGCCFVRGEGVEENADRAYECFRRVLELGGLYWEQTPNGSLWYRRSEGLSLIDLSQGWRMAGDVSSDVNYRFCEFMGVVVARDVTNATRGFKAAAEQRHSGGMFCFACALSDGGTKQNPEATKWFAEAALWLSHKAAVASSRSQTRIVKPAKPKINVPTPGKRSFMIPGNRYQRAKEEKERRKQVRTGHR